MKPPIKLFFENNEIATITDFGYEFPWASGTVIFNDTAFFLKMVNVTTMQFFDSEVEELNLSDEEEERLWEEKLSELSLSWEELDLEDDGKWSIQPLDENKKEICAVQFYKEGYMHYRL